MSDGQSDSRREMEKGGWTIRGQASGSSPAPCSAPLRWWIGERCCRARKTITVQARSRKEAQAKLDNDEGEGTDVTYYDIGRAKVIREDKLNK